MVESIDGRIVIETVQWKVRLMLLGLAIPAVVLALCAVVTVLVDEPIATAITGFSALATGAGFVVFSSRRRRDPRAQLILSADGVELPRGHRVLLPWTEVRSVSKLHGSATLQLTTRGFQMVHAHEPPWLVRLMRVFGRGITLPRQFEIEPERLAATLEAWRSQYGQP